MLNYSSPLASSITAVDSEILPTIRHPKKKKKDESCHRHNKSPFLIFRSNQDNEVIYILGLFWEKKKW